MRGSIRNGRTRAAATALVVALVLTGCASTGAEAPEPAGSPEAADPPSTSNPPADPRSPDDGVSTPQLNRDDPWAAKPELAWTWQTPISAQDGVHRAGDHLLLTPTWQEGEPARLHLISVSDGTHQWEVDLGGVEGVPAGYSVRDAVAAPGGEAVTVLLNDPQAPAGSGPAALARLAVADGQVLEVRTVGERDDAVAAADGVVVSDGARRQLSVLDPGTWQARQTVPLSPAGDRVSLEAYEPGLAVARYEGAGWAVVDLDAGSVVAQGDDDYVDATVSGDVVVTAVTHRTGHGNPFTEGCELTGWSREGQTLWSRELEPNWYCYATMGRPLVYRNVEGLEHGDLTTVDPVTGQDAWETPYPAAFLRVADPVLGSYGDIPGPFDAVLLEHADPDDGGQGLDLAVLDADTGTFRHFEVDLAAQANGYVRTPAGFLPRTPAAQVSYHSSAEPGQVWALDGLEAPVVEYVGEDLMVVRDGDAYLGYVPAG